MSSSSLDETTVRKATEGCRLVAGAGARVEVHAALGSTNERMAELADEGAPEGSLVVAARQERGRGRRGRSWASPEGGIYLSILLRPDDGMLRRLPVTLLGGLAAAEALDATAGVKTELKWPNDVLIGGRKVAGILGELTRDDGGHRLILGVGINVATPLEAFPDELAGIVTSLAAESEAPPGVADVLAAFLTRFEEHYLAVQRGGGAYVLSVAWTRMPILGKPIRVRLGDETVTGIANGLNATGGLVLEREDGRRQVVMAGEVEEVRPK